MKKTLVLAGSAALRSTSAMAQNIGVLVGRFDDNGLTVMRHSCQGWSRHFGPLVKVDRLMREVIQSEETKGPCA